MRDGIDMVYLGRSRLHLSRANLIQMLRTIAGFEREGWRIRLVLPPWPGNCDVSRRIDDIGIQERLDITASRLIAPRWKFWPYVLWNRQRLKGHTIYTRVSRISLALARYGIEHHLEIHDVQGLKNKGLLERIINQHRSGVLKWIFPISQAAGKELLSAGALSDYVRVIPCGVDVAAYENIHPFNATCLDHPRIVHIGKLGPARGLSIFEALASDADAEITLIGKQETPPKGNVRVIAFVPPRDVPQWYSECDVTLLPYQPEHYIIDSFSPLKLFEAMAAGRPIIASDHPTIREILRNEETALLVAPNDTEAWRSALKRLKNDRNLAIALAKNAKKEAAQYDYRYRARAIAETIGLQKQQG